MGIKTILLLILPVFLLASTAFRPVVCAAEERKVLSRNYVGLGVEVYAPERQVSESYDDLLHAVMVRFDQLEARLEDLINMIIMHAFRLITSGILLCGANECLASFQISLMYCFASSLVLVCFAKVSLISVVLGLLVLVFSCVHGHDWCGGSLCHG